jgi:CubicO group peptidase (beta-lactamase class C family)
MHRKIIIFIFVALLAATAFAQNNDAKVQEFEAFAARVMKAQQMPGLSVAVVQGDFRWSRGFGFADLENQVPATAESSYRMASVTKPMTAVAVLRLADEGKIDLDADVQTYAPFFPRKKFPITIRQLLSHQGGISHYRNYFKEGRIKDPKTTRDAIAIFAGFDLVNEPGTQFLYSSYGYNLLGVVVEEVSRQPFATYMTENVWKPLGMTSTLMDDPRAIIPHRVDGYVLDPQRKLQRSEYVDVSSRFGGGGTRSTVGDMVRLMEGLAAGKVLKPETREQAWSMQATRNQHLTRYGLGFGLYSRSGRYVIAHSGSQQETRTSLTYLPRAGLIVALASNFEDADLDPFEEKLIELFAGDPPPVNVRAVNGADAAVWDVLQTTYTAGLAYYDRYGRAMTTDSRELAEAFRYFQEALAPEPKRVAEGGHPVAGQPFVKVGSYIASVLAAERKETIRKDALYRDGALRFFTDYAAAARRPKLDDAVVARLRKWSEDWNRVWTQELRALTFYEPEAMDVLERHRDAITAAPLRPNFEGALIALAEREPANAKRALTLGAALYPDSTPILERLNKLPK